MMQNVGRFSRKTKFEIDHPEVESRRCVVIVGEDPYSTTISILRRKFQESFYNVDFEDLVHLETQYVSRGTKLQLDGILNPTVWEFRAFVIRKAMAWLSRTTPELNIDSEFLLVKERRRLSIQKWIHENPSKSWNALQKHFNLLRESDEFQKEIKDLWNSFQDQSE